MSDQRPFGGGVSGTALDDFPRPSCAETLGYEFISIDREAKAMKVAFAGTEALLNPAGTIQGGFLTAMLDDAMGSMLVALFNGEKLPSSVDIHTQYLRPAQLGRFICEARLKYATNSTAFVEATLYNDANEAVAHAVQTARLFPARGRK